MSTDFAELLQNKTAGSTTDGRIAIVKPDAGKRETKPESKPNAKDDLNSAALPEIAHDVPSRGSESDRTGRISNPYSDSQSVMSCTTYA